MNLSDSAPANAAVEPQRGSAPSSRDVILDAWRGVSVLLVILYHAVNYHFSQQFESAAAGTLEWKLDALAPLSFYVKRALFVVGPYFGVLGVKFFFVISGYIITALLLWERERKRRISLRAFYVRRAFRILPPLLLFLTLAAIATLSGVVYIAPESFLLGMGFLCNTGIGGCEFFLGHLWSLAVEEQFYIAWPLLVVALPMRNIPRLALGLVIAFLLLQQSSRLYVHGWIINNGASFACIAIGALYATSPALRAGINRLAAAPTILVAAIVLFARPVLHIAIPWQQQLYDLLTPLLITFVLFGCSRYRAVLEQRLAVTLLAKVGLVSYGAYLFQQLFLGPAEQYLLRSPLDHMLLGAAIVVGSYVLLEKPLIKIGARWSRALAGRGDQGEDQLLARIG